MEVPHGLKAQLESLVEMGYPVRPPPQRPLPRSSLAVCWDIRPALSSSAYPDSWIRGRRPFVPLAPACSSVVRVLSALLFLPQTRISLDVLQQNDGNLGRAFQILEERRLSQHRQEEADEGGNDDAAAAAADAADRATLSRELDKTVVALKRSVVELHSYHPERPQAAPDASNGRQRPKQGGLCCAAPVVRRSTMAKTLARSTEDHMERLDVAGLQGVVEKLQGLAASTA